MDVGAADRSLTKRILLRQGNVIFTCDSEGDVTAIAAQSGKILWHKSFDHSVSFCIGGSGNTLVLGTVAGVVIAFSPREGQPLWQTRLRGGAVTAISRQHRGILLVRSDDGRISSLSARNGKKYWQIKERLPALTLRGMSIPLFYEDLGLIGLDDGRLLFVLLEDGRIKSELRVGFLSSESSLDRIVDIDGQMKIYDGILYISSYQGRTMAVDLRSDRVLWVSKISSGTGVDVDSDYVYTVASDGSLVALDRYVGSIVWQEPLFSARKLNTPLAMGNFVVAGDEEGDVHWLSATTGKRLALFETGDAIVSPMLYYKHHAVVLNSEGDLLTLKSARLER